MALKHTRVAVTADDPAADVKMSDWNADHVIDADGADMVFRTDTPAVPATGKARIFGRGIAGKVALSILGPDGSLHTAQAHLGRTKIAAWLPIGATSTTVPAIGAATFNANTTTGRAVASTNLFTSVRRIGSTSLAGAGNSASMRVAALQWFRGNAAGVGGFVSISRWGLSDAATVATARFFVGMCGTISDFGNVGPSSLINIIGVGADNGDTNLALFHNDGSGTATKVDLGANFPAQTLNTDLYELCLYCPPNAAYVNYLVRRLNTGDNIEGQITTDLPAATQLLGYQFWRNNNSTALAVTLDVCSLIVETET